MVAWRLAGSADAPALAEVRRKAWESVYRGIYPDEMLDHFDLEDHAGRILKNMTEPGKDVYILEDGELAVGFFIISVPEKPFYHDIPVCLNALYLIPEYHRQGIGRKMMAFAKAWCREREYDRFFLSCSLHNTGARAFYEAMGGVLGAIDGGHADRGADTCCYEFEVA